MRILHINHELYDIFSIKLKKQIHEKLYFKCSTLHILLKIYLFAKDNKGNIDIIIDNKNVIWSI